jgi:4-hydroxy 2-oxovalerate aldolase
VSSNLSILDCTLRDGGYYNNWGFSDEFVTNYLQVIAATNVSIFEIGYRNPGDCSHEDYENYIEKVTENNTLGPASLAIMIDAKKFIGDGMDAHSLVHDLFLPQHKSQIAMVRIAIHYRQLGDIEPLVKIFSDLGYRVAVNLMQIDMASPEELAARIEIIDNISDIEVVYIADSFGSMNAGSVANIFSLFKSGCGKSLGFHAHDNKGLALTNAQAAIAEGAEYIDATLMGMGRGAGNAKTEEVLPIFYSAPSGLKELQRFLAAYLAPLHRQYLWGGDDLYGFAADNAMHPMYVQVVKKRASTDKELAMSILQSLAERKCHQYTQEILDYAMSELGVRW